MAIAFRARAHNEADSATSIVVTKPGGVVDGDLIIAQILQDSATATLTADTGTWTAFAESADETTMRSRSFWRKADSEPSTWTFSTTDANNDIGVIVGVFYEDSGVGDWTLEDE